MVPKTAAIPARRRTHCYTAALNDFLNLFKQNEIRGKRNSRFIYVGRDFYSKGDSLLVVKSGISSAHSHEQCDDDRGIETMAEKESF
jgi:hypothetical protein